MANDNRTLEQTIALQTEGAIASLRSLRSEVKQVTDEWKLQHAQLRQNGEYEEAYKTKVEGLDRAMQEQRQGIDRLKQTMQGISTETKAGAEAHDKLAQEVLKAERNLQTMSEQQEKAKNTLSLYESGIIQARRELEQSERVSTSYQEKLRAEGHELEANQEKRRFLGEKIQSLQNLQEKENSILEKVRHNSGETSEAFQRQAVRVNELGTKVAHSKKEFTELDSVMSKRPRLNFAVVREQLDKVNEKAEKTHHIFGKILGAELIGRATIAGLQSLQMNFTEALHAGMAFNEEQQVMSAAWNTLTSDATKAQGMVKTINDLSVATGRSRDLVNELEQGFYHLHSSKKESDNLTKSMLNMGDAVGLTDDQITTVTQDMVHGLATGKLNLQEMNQLSQYFPMFGEALLDYEKKVTHNSKLTMAELRQMTKQGKISSDTVEKLFNELGQDKYGKAADNMLQTMSGMKRTITSQVPALIGAFEKPILTAKNPFYGAISKWVSDHKTQDKFTEMGNSAEKGVETILSAFQQVLHPSSSVNMADNLLDYLNDHMKSGSQYIADHAPQIVQFLVNAKDATITLFERGGQTLRGFYKVAKPFLEVIGKYPKQFGEFIAIMYLTKPAISGVTLAMKGFSIFKTASGWVGSLLSNLRTFEGLKIGNLFGSGKLSKEANGSTKLAKGLEESVGFIGKLEKGLPILAAFTSLLELHGMTEKTVGKHIGAAIGNLGGALSGAALGSAILPGIGTLAGGILGAFGGTNIGKKLGEQIQNGMQSTFSKKSSLKESFAKQTAGLSDQVTKEFAKIQMGTSKFSDGEVKKIQSLYDDLQKRTDKFFAEKEKQSKKDLDLLVKTGIITQQQEDKALKQEQAKDKTKKKVIQDAYKNQAKIVNDYYKRYNNTVKRQKTNEEKTLNAYAKKFGKNSQKYRSEKLKLESENRKELESLHTNYFKKLEKAQDSTDLKISKELDVSAKRQRNILEHLRDEKHKISLKEATDTIQQSKRARDEVIKNATKTSKDKAAKANEQYRNVVNAAKKERDESGIITQSQYSDIVSKAKKQRDDTVSAAEDQKNKQIKKAEDTHVQVVDHATKQAGEHKGALDKETGYVVGGAKDQAEATYNGIDAIVDAIDWVWEMFTNKKTKIPYVKRNNFASLARHKDGLHDVSVGELAVVGEEGFELAHSPSKGIYPVGTKGEEVRYLEPHTSILPHEQSKMFLNMSSGLPHYKEGAGSFFDHLLEKAKEAISSLSEEATALWNTIGGDAGKAWDYITDKFNVTKTIEKYKGQGEYFEPTSGFVLKEAKSAVTEMLKKFLDVIGESMESVGSGTRGEFVKIVEKQGDKPYVWGAEGPDAFDCSGLVKWGLAQLGIHVDHYSGDQFRETQAINEDQAKPGDLSFYGLGGSEHVGIVTGKNKMFAAQSPYNHPNIGPDSIHNGLPFSGIHRVTQLSDNGGGESNFAGNWGNAITDAARKMHISINNGVVQTVLGLIHGESGGDQRAIGGNDGLPDGNATGLLQFKPNTFAAYAVSGHKDIFNGYDQLLAMFNDSNWTSDIHPWGGWSPTGSRRFGGGWERGGFISRHGYYELGEGNREEAIIPLHKGMRSLDMLYKTMAKLGVSPAVQITNDQTELIELAKGQLRELTEQNTFLRKIVDLMLQPKSKQSNDYHALLERMQKNKRVGDYQWG